MKPKSFVQQNGSSASSPGTHTIMVSENAGRLVPEPAELDVVFKLGETVVWKSDNARQFYVNFSPFTTHLSGLEDGRQTIVLPVVTEFSLGSIGYEVGYVDAPDSSSSGIITCSTCGPSD